MSAHCRSIDGWESTWLRAPEGDQAVSLRCPLHVAPGCGSSAALPRDDRRRCRNRSHQCRDSDVCGRSYWQFACGVTVAIVLFSGASSSFPKDAFGRLEATMIGMAMALVAVAITVPISKRYSERTGDDKFSEGPLAPTPDRGCGSRKLSHSPRLRWWGTRLSSYFVWGYSRSRCRHVRPARGPSVHPHSRLTSPRPLTRYGH